MNRIYIATKVLGGYKRKILIKGPAHGSYSANLRFLPLEQFSLGREKGKEREMLSLQTEKFICIPSLGK